MSNKDYDFEFDGYCEDEPRAAPMQARPVLQGKPGIPVHAPPGQTPKPPPGINAQQLGVLYMQLLCQSLDVITEVSTPITGDSIEDHYTAIYVNNTNNPIRVQVFADLVTPGCGALLSTSPNDGDSDKYDALTLTANGRTESVGIILMPTMKIYAKNFQPLIPMAAIDVIRVRVFDPMKLMSFARLYPQSGKVF